VKLGDVFSSLVTPVFKLWKVLCIPGFSQTLAVVGMVLQDVQCCCSHVMCSSCVQDVGCSQERVCCPCCRTLGLHKCLHPTTPSQPVPQCLQCCHLYVEATKHHHYLVFTIAVWPLPLYLLGQSKQWLIKGDHWLSKIQVFHSIFHDID